jgi:hypothetical protein
MALNSELSLKSRADSEGHIRDQRELAQRALDAKVVDRNAHPTSWHPDDLLTSSELAGSLKISERTPENWRLNGAGPPFIRVGGRRVLYRWRDVLEYLEARRFSSTTEEQTA